MRRRLLPSLAVVLATAAAPIAAPIVTSSAPALAATQAVDGPDVSSYQHPNGKPIDWASVKRSGRTFAFVKATEGTWYTNPWYARDSAAIAANRLVRGSYHYARPAWPAGTAIAQAKYYVGVIGSTRSTGTLPPALDLEEDGGLTPAQLVTWAQVWLDTVHTLTGRTPIIYTYRWFWRVRLADSNAFTRYPLWIAEYDNPSGPSQPLVGGWPTWTFWQFTSGASVPGLPAGVDMSNFNGSGSQMATFADGTAPQPWPVQAPASPVQVTAAVGSRDGSAVVSWLPADNGGSLVRSYTLTASPGGKQVLVSGTTTRTLVTGLQDGVQYTFTVVASSDAGSSAPSAPSNVVVPAVPTAFASSLSAGRVTIGAAVTMAARLYRPDNGAPVAGKQLAVYTAPHGTGQWSQAGTVTTDANGNAAWTWRPSRNTDVFLRWPGEPTWQPAQTYTRTVLAAPVVTARVSTAKITPNHTVVLTGLSGPRRPGTPVYRQQYYGGHWHLSAITRAAADGTYRFAIRPSRRGTYLFRVVFAPSASYTVSASRTVVLRVI
jgi:GH25 family lysozyme M1 (1,4-beta-N-acetylmuramidase)